MLSPETSPLKRMEEKVTQPTTPSSLDGLSSEASHSTLSAKEETEKPSGWPAETTTGTRLQGTTSLTAIRTREEAEDVEYLPYRTLAAGARMDEYTNETATGEILRTVRSNATGKVERYEVVTFTVGDKENPKNWSKAYKWWCTMCVAVTCFVVAFNSGVVTADLAGVAETFNCSDEVAFLTITFFVMVRHTLWRD